MVDKYFNWRHGMSSGRQDGVDLVQVVAPVLGVIPQLWTVIARQKVEIDRLTERVTVLELRLEETQERAEVAEEEAVRWYHQSLRLEGNRP